MAITVQFYNQFWKNVGNNNINLASHTFKVMLVHGYTFDDDHDEKTDLGAVELANGNGYTTGGVALSGLTWDFDSGNNLTKWDADDVSLTASGGSLGPARGAVIYDDTSTGDKLVCYIDFGQDESAGSGTEFRLTFNANGVFGVGVAA